MNKSQLMAKLAGPGVGEKIGHWALPKEQRFPIDTAGLLKMATVEFDIQPLSPCQRLVAARHMAARAEELGVRGWEKTSAFKYASSHLSPHFDAFVAMRKEAAAWACDEELDKLIKVAHILDAQVDINERVRSLDKIAHALEAFDREHELSDLWGHEIPDPAFTVFSPTVDIDDDLREVVKVGERHVSSDDLQAADWDRVSGHLPSEVIDGLRNADDKLAVYASLPAPEREIICQHLFG